MKNIDKEIHEFKIQYQKNLRNAISFEELNKNTVLFIQKYSLSEKQRINLMKDLIEILKKEKETLTEINHCVNLEYMQEMYDPKTLN